MPSTAEHPAMAFLRQVAAVEPRFWRRIDEVRVNHLAPDAWPNWCYLPTSVLADQEARLIDRRLSYREISERSKKQAVMLELTAWRASQIICRFDPDLAEALNNSPLDGPLPSEMLLRLPSWCIFIETPWITVRSGDGIDIKAAGCFVSTDDQSGTPVLHIDLIAPVGAVYMSVMTTDLLLGDWSIDEAVRRVFDIAHRLIAPGPARDRYRSDIDRYLNIGADELSRLAWLAREVLPLILYLCSDRPDLPNQPPTRRTKADGRLVPPPAPLIWDVGLRIGAALRRARQDRDAGDSSAGHGSPRRPHMRAAHWHTYWTGPKKNDQPQKPRVRWIPPIGVNLDLGETVATVRPVKL